MPGREGPNPAGAASDERWSLPMDGRDAAGAERLRHVFEGRQPAGLAEHLTDIRFDTAYLTGTTARSLAPTYVRLANDLWVPAGTKLRPAPIDLFKLYLTHSEVAERELPLAEIAERIYRSDRVKLLQACAGLLGVREALATDTQEHDEALAVEWFRPGVRETVLTKVRDGRALVAPQGVMLLAKLAIEAGAREGGADPDTWQAILLGLMDHVGSEDRGPDADRSATERSLSRFMLRTQSFHSRFEIGIVLGQGHLRWWALAHRLPRQRDWTDPLDAFHEATGVDFRDFQAFGLGLWARAMERPGEPIAMDWFRSFGWPAERFEAILRLIARDLDALADLLHTDGDRQGYEWDFDPLRRFPVVRLDAECLLVISPRLLIERIHGWLPFFDIRDGLRAKGLGKKAKHFEGTFRRICALEAVESLRAITAGGTAQRVYEDEDLTRAFGDRTKADVAIDCGGAWVVVEISARNLKRPTIIDGSEEHLEDDLQKGIYRKAEQLDATIRDLIEDETRLTGAPAVRGRRYVPVLVATDGFPVNPMTVTRIESGLRARGLLSDPRIGPLRILDQEALYVIEAIVESGNGGLLDLLDGYADGGLRAMPFIDWARFERSLEIARPTRLVPAVHQACLPALEALGVSDDEAA